MQRYGWLSFHLTPIADGDESYDRILVTVRVRRQRLGLAI